MSEPVITPSKWLGRDSLPPTMVDCSLAILGFCRFFEMKSKLAVEPLIDSLFSHLDLAHQFIGHIDNQSILALECLYGGPLSATVIEELAHYGIKKVIGYGYAGSLTGDLPVGELVLAEEAAISDGTSREYLPSVDTIYPARKLVEHFERCATECGIILRGARFWTTDAIYREYPEKVRMWRERGCKAVNMDTSYFYAVSEVVGISAVYACVISDCVEGPIWEDGFIRARQSIGLLQDLIIASAGKMLNTDLPCRNP